MNTITVVMTDEQKAAAFLDDVSKTLSPADCANCPLPYARVYCNGNCETALSAQRNSITRRNNTVIRALAKRFDSRKT